MPAELWGGQCPLCPFPIAAAVGPLFPSVCQPLDVGCPQEGVGPEMAPRAILGEVSSEPAAATVLWTAPKMNASAVKGDWVAQHCMCYSQPTCGKVNT